MSARHLTGLVALAASLCSAAPAGAASANYTSAQRHRALVAFAGCLLEEKREQALDYALDVPGTPSKALVRFKCATEAVGRDFFILKIPREVMAGALAEIALSKAELVTVDAAIATSPPPEPVKELTANDFDPTKGTNRKRWEASLPQINAQGKLYSAVDCTIHKSPAQARAVFAAPFGSDQESQAVGALLPVLGQCLVVKEMRLRPDTLRTALAMRYLALANRAVPEFRKRLI